MSIPYLDKGSSQPSLPMNRPSRPQEATMIERLREDYEVALKEQRAAEMVARKWDAQVILTKRLLDEAIRALKEEQK